MPKKKWWFIAVVLFGIIGWIFGKMSSNLPVSIEVGRETTYLTEPLDADGLPDYDRWWLERQRARAGNSNGAIAFWQAMWPGDYDQESQELIRAELGAEIPNGPGTFRSYESPEVREAVCDWLIAGWIAAHPALADEEPDSLRRHAADFAEYSLVGLMERPFTAESIPPLADWISDQSETIVHLLGASHSDGWYSPSAGLLKTPASPFIMLDLGFAHSARAAARVLQARASYEMGLGDLDEAWKCCQAIRSLGDACGDEEVLVSHLVACALYNMYLEIVQVLIQQPHVEHKLLRQIQSDAKVHWSPIAMANCIDVGERILFLDSVGRMAHGRENGLLDEDDQETLFLALQSGHVNWNRIMKSANDVYDNIAEAMQRPDWSERQQALDEIDNRIQSLLVDRQKPKRLMWAFFDRDTRSDLIGNVLIGLCVPATMAVAVADDRINTQWELTQQVVAIELYRHQKGQYPATLQELVPDYLPTLPVDLFHQAPYVYRRTESGFLLYSHGANGTDDQGSHERNQVLHGYPLENEFDRESICTLLANEVELPPSHADLPDLIPRDADDYAVRFPTPKRGLPTPPMVGAEVSDDAPQGDP